MKFRKGNALKSDFKNKSLNVRAMRLPFKDSSLNENKDPLIWVWREQEDKVSEAGGASEIWKLNDYKHSKEDSLRFWD